jgi:hypothetical protein
MTAARSKKLSVAVLTLQPKSPVHSFIEAASDFEGHDPAKSHLHGHSAGRLSGTNTPQYTFAVKL